MTLKNINLKYSISFLVVLFIAGCGGNKSNNSNEPVPNQSTVTIPLTDPLYTQCMSTTLINPNNPNQPVITLNGTRVINQPLNASYVDAGASANDPTDGDISKSIKITGLDSVDTNKVGDYVIRYAVTNNANLPAIEAVRIVRVNSGTFTAQTARDIGSTSAHLGYYEHLPVHYSDDPSQKFPLIIFQHGWFNARFFDSTIQQAPLSILENANIVKAIKLGLWDDAQPFIVLSLQKCTDPSDAASTYRTKLFIDYAINTYQVDTSRIYMMGHSQGAYDTWRYAAAYPNQLAAIVPISGYYDKSGCDLKNTPAWAFNGDSDSVVDFNNLVATVNSINACQPVEQAKVTVFKGLGHNDLLDPILTLTGLGSGLSKYDIYNKNIYDWMLQYKSM